MIQCDDGFWLNDGRQQTLELEHAKDLLMKQGIDLDEAKVRCDDDGDDDDDHDHDDHDGEYGDHADDLPAGRVQRGIRSPQGW
jgi:hypothetical protein